VRISIERDDPAIREDVLDLILLADSNSWLPSTARMGALTAEVS